MAYGKNKKLSKTGKKGAKKKTMDPFLRKVWYDVKVPTYFKTKNTIRAGRTCVTKTTGQRIETEELKGRICEFNGADLQDMTEEGHKKFKFEIQEIRGKSCLTDFHALSLTRDKMCAMIKKRHTLIEAQADCKTADGYVVRLFVIAFTKRVQASNASAGQLSPFTYAQAAQIKRIRRKIVNVLQTTAGAGQLKDLVTLLTMDKIEQDIKRAAERVFPLDPVHIMKAKVVKKPKLDVAKLFEIHGSADADMGVAVDPNEPEEAKNLLSA